MGNISDAARNPGDVMRRLAELERQIRDLQTARRLESSSIGRGGLTVTNDGGITVSGFGRITISEGGSILVNDADGTEIFYAGGFQDGGFGVRLNRPGDDPAAIELLGFSETGPRVLRMFDRSGNEILGEDGNTGQGLARPFIPGQLYPSPDTTDGSMKATDSGSFTVMYEGVYVKQHPRLIVNFWAQTPAGVTAQVRVMHAGVQVGSTVNVPAGTFTSHIISGTPIGAHTEAGTLELQMRVASGAGTVRCVPRSVYGEQS